MVILEIVTIKMPVQLIVTYDNNHCQQNFIFKEMIVMKSNRSKISKFIAAITLASSAISSFDGCVSGMESGYQSEQTIIDNLSKEFLKLVKTKNEFNLTQDLVAMVEIFSVDPKYYVFYEHGMTLDNVLDNLKKWIKKQNPEENLFTNKEANEYAKRFEKRLIKKFKKHGEEKCKKDIDFIFEQISKSISREEEATEENMTKLRIIIGGVYGQINKKWNEIEEGKQITGDFVKYGLLKEHAGEDCAICLYETNKRDIVLPCCHHYMHKDCLKDWIKHDNRCPICKLTLNQQWIKDKLE